MTLFALQWVSGLNRIAIRLTTMINQSVIGRAFFSVSTGFDKRREDKWHQRVEKQGPDSVRPQSLCVERIAQNHCFTAIGTG